MNTIPTHFIPTLVIITTTITGAATPIPAPVALVSQIVLSFGWLRETDYLRERLLAAIISDSKSDVRGLVPRSHFICGLVA